jgi:hypothetical protein
MEIYNFVLAKRSARVPLGRGSLAFGLALYENVGLLHAERNAQIDVDAHLWDILTNNEAQAVDLWDGHTAFLAEGIGPMAGYKSLCLCCKEWRHV